MQSDPDHYKVQKVFVSSILFQFFMLIQPTGLFSRHICAMPGYRCL